MINKICFRLENYSLNKNELDYVNSLVEKYKDIRDIKDTILKSTQEIINKRLE